MSMRKLIFVFLTISAFWANLPQSFGVIYVTRDTSWTGNVLLSQDVVVKSGFSLTIQPGTQLRMNYGISIVTETGATILMPGTAAQPIRVSPSQPAQYWGNIHAKGIGSSLDMTFVESIGGQIKATDSALCDVRDCILRDYNLYDNPILLTKNASNVYVSRTHVANYYEINIILSPAVVEDCLFEFMTADAIDFDNSPSGTVIRRTTIRYGRGDNIDAIDFGKVDFQPPGSQGLVENCRVHDISDKGVSVGEGAIFVTVKGSLFYRCGAGIAVKDSSVSEIYNNTFYGCEYGIELVEKNPGLGGGHGTAYNNILWNNGGSIYMNSDATLAMSYSNVQGAVADTVQHISVVDPLFMDPANDDFQLQPGSPMIGQGINGEDLGAIFPAGGIAAPSDELQLGLPNATSVLVVDSALQVYWAAGPLISSVDVLFSTDGGSSWTMIATSVPAQQLSTSWTVPNVYSSSCYFRVQDHNDTTHFSSNERPFKIMPPLVSNLKADYSINSGFFTQPFDLFLTTVPGATIYYTLDGSDPTDQSFVYQQPLTLSSSTIYQGYPEQNVTSSQPAHAPYSYVRLAPVRQTGLPPSIWYKPPGQIDRQCVVRTRVHHPVYGLGPIVTKSYFIHPDVFSGRFPLPVVSLATDPSGLFDYYKGTFIPGAAFEGAAFTGNYELSGRASERPAHIDYFDGNKQKQLSQEIGIRVKGQWIRSLGQKCLGLYAREDYDVNEDDFDYAIFPNNNKPGTDTIIDEYKRLLLRQNGNDWGSNTNTMCRDALAQSLLDHCNVKYQAYQPAMVYLNGEFWGLSNLREMNDEEDISRNYNIEEDSLVIMEDNLDKTAETPFLLMKGNPGDDQSFFNMRNFVWFCDKSTDAALDSINRMMDVDNFTDYWIGTIYLGKTTSAHNQMYWRIRTPEGLNASQLGHDGRWRWTAFDFDNAMFWDTLDNFNVAPYYVYDDILIHLWEFEGYRKQFVNRFCDVVNSSFVPERVAQRIDEYESRIAPAMQWHIDRWRTPRSIADWQSGMNDMRQYAYDRPVHAFAHMQQKFSLPGSYNLTLDISQEGAGYIGVNSLLIKEDLPGVDSVQLYPWNGTYFTSVPVTITAYPLPGYIFDHWMETGDTLSQITVDAAFDTVRTAVFRREVDPKLPYVSVYPNPVQWGETVRLDHHCEFYVYAADGRECMHELDDMQFSTVKLVPGCYYIRIIGGPVERLVVTR